MFLLGTNFRTDHAYCQAISRARRVCPSDSLLNINRSPHERAPVSRKTRRTECLFRRLNRGRSCGSTIKPRRRICPQRTPALWSSQGPARTASQGLFDGKKANHVRRSCTREKGKNLLHYPHCPDSMAVHVLTTQQGQNKSGPEFCIETPFTLYFPFTVNQ